MAWNDGRPETGCIETYFREMDAAGRRASTIASAIEINRPVNLRKCLRALHWCSGVVRQVSDEEILDAKAQGRRGRIRSANRPGGQRGRARLLAREGVIAPDERVVCILTGHELKDPTATVAYHTHDAKYFDEVLRSRSVQQCAVREPGGAGGE